MKQKMNHKVARMVFGFSVGVIVALLSYRWIADTGPRIERQQQERAVIASRAHLHAVLDIGELELVDPLSPDRVVGKACVSCRRGLGSVRFLSSQ